MSHLRAGIAIDHSGSFLAIGTLVVTQPLYRAQVQVWAAGINLTFCGGGRQIRVRGNTRVKFVESAIPEICRARWSGQRDVCAFASQIRTGFRRQTEIRETVEETPANCPSPRLPLLMERATGRPRICFANTHRLQAPAGAFACSLQTLRVCLTLAPCRVRVPALY